MQCCILFVMSSILLLSHVSLIVLYTYCTHVHIPQVDICVHSMKDVPTWLPEGTVLPCNLEREETNDVFICKKYPSLQSLPNGSVIGSASLRRQAQLLAMNPTLKVVNFRGNVQTRLKKIENGMICLMYLYAYDRMCTLMRLMCLFIGDPVLHDSADVVDGTMLALAGLKRLHMEDVIATSQVINWDTMLPAVAQGAIGIQCRSQDTTMLRYLAALNHAHTKACVDCERSFLAKLDGNCRTPIAGQARVVGGSILFRGLISMPDGTRMIEVTRSGAIQDAVRIGEDAGNEIRAIAGAGFADYQHAVQVVQDAAAAAKVASSQ